MRPSATSFDKIDDGTGVVATVSDEVAIRLDAFEQSRRQWSCRSIAPAIAQSLQAFPDDRLPR